MLWLASAVLLFALIVLLCRAAMGPTMYDRLQVSGAFVTITVLLVCVHGVLRGRPDFMDMALVYALMGFVSVLAIMKFFEYGDMGRGTDDEPESNV